MTQMKIRPTYMQEGEFVAEHGPIEIVADDGRSLYTIDLKEDGSLDIHTSGFVKHNDKILDSGLYVKPHACNMIKVFREEYKKEK